MSDHIDHAAAGLRDHTWQTVSIRGLTKCAGPFTEHMYTVGVDDADHEAHQAYWLDAAGLLASPEHDAQVAARAVRDAVEWMDEITPDGVMVTRLQVFDFLNDYADRIEREGGTDEDA